MNQHKVFSPLFFFYLLHQNVVGSDESMDDEDSDVDVSRGAKEETGKFAKKAEVFLQCGS